MTNMFAGDISLNITGMSGNADRQMNRVLRDIVQYRTNDCLAIAYTHDHIAWIILSKNRPGAGSDLLAEAGSFLIQ